MNLKRCYPEKTEAEIDTIVRGVWDNLGRGAGEWGQVDLIPTTGPRSRVEIVGEEHLLNAIENDGPFIVFSAHMANWEIGSLVPAHRGAPLVNIYRFASIPIMAKAVPDDAYCGLADPDQLMAGKALDLDLYDDDEPGTDLLQERAKVAEDAALSVAGVTNSEGGSADWSRFEVYLAGSNGMLARYRTRTRVCRLLKQYGPLRSQDGAGRFSR